MSAAELIAEARAAGVELVLDGGRIRFEGCCPADLLERLRAGKRELLEALLAEAVPPTAGRDLLLVFTFEPHPPLLFDLLRPSAGQEGQP